MSTKDIRHPSNRVFHILGASICIICAALLLVAAPETSLLLTSPGLNHLPTITAHRGGDEAAPETSLQSFQAAASANFPLEMDLRPLSDSGIAISHDATTGGVIKSIRSTAVGTLSSTKWSSLCLTAKTSTCYRPTTLTQVLAAFAPSVPMIIENKEADVTTSRLEAIITQAHRTATTLVESLDINEIKQLSTSGFHTLYVMHKNQQIDMAAVAQAGTDVLAVSSFYPTSTIAKAHARGVQLWVWTVDRQFMALRWARAGVDGIITDHPFAIRTLLAMDYTVSQGIATPQLVRESFELQCSMPIRKRAHQSARCRQKNGQRVTTAA